MKKVFFAILSCIISTQSYATEMCANDDTIVIPLYQNAPNANAYTCDTNKSKHNNTNFYARTCFSSMGCFHMESTVLSEAEGGISSANVFLNSFGERYPIDGSISKRFGTDPDGNPRKYCWCRLTHPISSYWWHAKSCNDPNDCARYCTMTLCYDTGGLRSTAFETLDL